MAQRTIWEIEVEHVGLNKYRHIRGTDKHVVEQKAAAQLATWDAMWNKRKAADRKKRERERAARTKEAKKKLAAQKTEEAESRIEDLRNLLSHTLGVDDAIDWNALMRPSPFPVPEPEKPTRKKVPREPSKQDPMYVPPLDFLDRVFSSRRQKKLAKAQDWFNRDHANWRKTRAKINERNALFVSAYNVSSKQWLEQKAVFDRKQAKKVAKIAEKKASYFENDEDAILDYCEMVLSNSDYPDSIPQEWEIEYRKEGRILIVDYDLPNIDSFPKTKAVRYVISRDEFVETKLSAADNNRIYNSALYQIALRTLHELFEADVVDALGTIVFNGWVPSVDKRTGQKIRPCILSVQASKAEFENINLAMVDPKACFRNLNGVSAAKLQSMAAVAPIINIEKTDKRFVEGYAVADFVDEADNLAAMDWKDFENLVRELFEKEFSDAGGEVKVTQSSRDGGVDAVAFDPDPIRGGKIVIQAKRYTNVVGLSAVRDLYGTVMNEGATKGILVTTAEYGPDAYKFAKGKPLTLLNGGNLLHLLEKHGHRARIDLAEAKKILAEYETR